jgi:hypothetical protein
MKSTITAFCLLICTHISAQDNLLFFVRSISGSAKKPNSTILSPGDTIRYSMLSKLALNPKSTVVNLLSANGPFSYFIDSSEYLSDQKISKKVEDEFENVAEIFRLKGSNIQLSSRGGCIETLDDCLKTDPAINEKILVIDTLWVPVSENENGDIIKYFLQWKHNDIIYNNKLTVINGKVKITANDLIFKGIKYDESEAVKLGIIKYDNAGKSYSDIAKIKLSIASSHELREYYSGLSMLLHGETQATIFERFYKEVYIFLGKPDLCVLKSLVYNSK